ncbi:hypothetical protein BUALT_Bualt10G0002100 [Buddleja alternifolia]|uniref:Hexosyltransferase n=1 Tax=Buddleja alternifolia TaxID=168488 RepID=A0AAV6WWA5_9LAMI|nr:hypothetical protein BUALT_Bualt10G0002100 [Buddleja alternifolia]
MGLMVGSRASHKGCVNGGNVSGFSTKWVSLFCIASFCFGLVVVNSSGVEASCIKIQEMIQERKCGECFGPLPIQIQTRMLHLLENIGLEIFILLLSVGKRQEASESGDILSQVSKTHDIIMTLDKTISSLEMQLSAARAAKAENDEKPKDAKLGNDPSSNRPKMLFVMGIITAFSSRKRRDSIRDTWMPQGNDLKKLEKEKGIIIRFVIGHSATPGGVLDRAIDAEEAQHKDFMRLNHVEGYHELSSKTQIYFSTAAAKWDADFYIKVDDDVHVNLGIVSSLLARHQSKPRVYIGCMKSGPVLAQKGVKYHEPEHWKFGEDGNKYFRHATGQIYAISKDLATYISVNRHILHKYANEDVSLGSWFIGLDVEHIDERSLCCGTPPGKPLKLFLVIKYIASGRRKLGTLAVHHLIGAVVAYANLQEEWKKFINVVVKAMEIFDTPFLE